MRVYENSQSFDKGPILRGTNHLKPCYWLQTGSGGRRVFLTNYGGKLLKSDVETVFILYVIFQPND